MITNKADDDYSGRDDDEALMWLKEVDPAADLRPLPAWQIDRLKESLMTTTTKPKSAPARRRRAIAIAGALAATAIIGTVAVTTLGPDDGGATALTAPPAGDPAMMCAQVTPEALASSTLAFKGTVTSTTDGTATLTVDDVYTGDLEQTVTIPQGEPDTQIDGAAPLFDDGVTYLVSTTDDVIRSCGLTGTDNPELEAIYKTAFRS